MTITFGLWMVPTLLTVVAVVHIGTQKQTDQWGLGNGLTAAIWFFVVVTSWVMWGLSWL